MKDRLTDEMIDKIMHSLVADAGADDATINEINDAPSVWWAVQRNILEKKSAAKSPWPPIAKLLRFAAVCVPVAAGLLFVISYFSVNQNSGSLTSVRSESSLSANETPSQQIVNSINNPEQAIRETSAIPAGTSVSKRNPVSVAKTPVRPAVAIKSRATDPSKDTIDEIKSEFIALTYARNPESGQIVRVKVPRSMMVTLGLVASVEKPTSLVDAEVLVGDDGTTHSIRFIR